MNDTTKQFPLKLNQSLIPIFSMYIKELQMIQLIARKSNIINFVLQISIRQLANYSLQIFRCITKNSHTTVFFPRNKLGFLHET